MAMKFPNTGSTGIFFIQHESNGPEYDDSWGVRDKQGMGWSYPTIHEAVSRLLSLKASGRAYEGIKCDACGSSLASKTEV